MRAVRFLAVLGACGDPPPDSPPPPPAAKPSHVEQTIATQLSAKLGRATTVSCTATGCTADLGDAVLPIAIAKGSGDLSWSVDGLLVRAAPIEAYLSAALVDLGAPQKVSCGPAIRSVPAGARIECALERGGKAFAVIAANGTFATEIDLDPAAAEARSTDATQLSPAQAGSASSDEDD
jgi:hypothetical protein